MRFATVGNLKSIAAQIKSKYSVDICAGASGGTSNSATTTGNTYINLVEGGSNRSGVRLVPGTNMSITSDASGNVTFSSSGGSVSALTATEISDAVAAALTTGE